MKTSTRVNANTPKGNNLAPAEQENQIEKYTRQIKQIIDRNPDEYFLQKLLMKAASWERVFHKNK